MHVAVVVKPPVCMLAGCLTTTEATGDMGSNCSVRVIGKPNNFSGVDGVVQIKIDGNWTFINGSNWDYEDAMVACKQLGKYLQ